MRRNPVRERQPVPRPTTASGRALSPAVAGARAGAGPAIEISHLRKAYGAQPAVDDVSFSVHPGEIFGILGPNGAGKTTTVECVLGLRAPDSGTVRLMGLDPQADRTRVHEITGVQLQSGAFPAKLRVGEIIDMYRSFYPHPADAGELAGALGLAGLRRAYYQSLSGGQQQRLSVLLALIGAPDVAVLDEMTTGLDPQARRAAWDLIKRVRDRGTTILLVTHFMAEAERLCDRIALVNAGRLVALDTPAGLTARAADANTVRFLMPAQFDESLLTCLPEVTAVALDGPYIVVTGAGEIATAVIVALHAAGIEAQDVRTGTASMESAFLRLTGEHTRETTAGEQL